MKSSVFRRRKNAGSKWREIINISRGVGLVKGFEVREGAPWLMEVNMWRE